MELFVGFRDPNPGLHVKVCQQTPILLALSEVTCLRRPKSHPKQYGMVLELGFCTLGESRQVKLVHNYQIYMAQGCSQEFQ